MDRRKFIAQSTSAAAAVALAHGASAKEKSAGPNDRIAIAAMGVRGRGGRVLATFASRSDVDVKYVCDVDTGVLAKRTAETEESTGRRPQDIKDFRRALEDDGIDALVVGTPEHWHAIPTIQACQAGKDVYVEKPDSHNILESRTMVEAQRKYKRVIQLGTQSRSGQHFKDAIEYIKGGNIGRALFAKAWESARQGSIGKPADSQPPAGVDYDLWLGPAPKRPFNVRRFHGHWRWFFDYGTGDLGNDGVHRLDVARWALESAIAAAGDKPLPAHPLAVSAHGAKCYFDDLQEWPDNLMVTYDYGDGRVITYEMRIWTPYRLEGQTEGALVYGDKGYVILGNSGWQAFGPRNEPIKRSSGSYNNDAAHVEDFLACMASREKPVADLETIGHASSMMCHLGCAAWKAGRTLRLDPKSYTFESDADANQYLTRPEYRKPWVLPDLADV